MNSLRDKDVGSNQGQRGGAQPDPWVHLRTVRGVVADGHATLFKVNTDPPRNPSSRGLSHRSVAVWEPHEPLTPFLSMRPREREDCPVRDGAMAVHLGKFGRIQLVRERGPADSAA